MPPLRRISLCSLITLVSLTSFQSSRALDAEQSSGSGNEVPKVEFEKYVLPNGLQVILHVDHKLPMVHVNCWYHVGSKNERAGRTGFAHLFEHMMFEGSQNANRKYLASMETAGANLLEGGVNGTTNTDRTNYFETVPSGSLEYVIWLESDRLATLTDVLTKTKLDNEREIVKNERRQGLENEPYGRAFSLIMANVFPAGHPYQHDVIGVAEDLNAATVDDVKDFFHTYYTPNNLSLAVTGDFDVAEAKRYIEKYFGPVAPGPPLDRPKHWMATLDAQKVIEVNDHVPQDRTYLAWPSPAFFEKGDAELDLTSLILTDGLSARLNKSLVYDRQLCSDTFSFQNSMETAGFFALMATARPGASLAEIEQTITDEIARLSSDGPSQQELDRAKAKWEFQYLTGLERIGGFGGQADLLNSYNTFLGNPDKFTADIARHRSVSVQGVKEASAAWLNTSKRVDVRFHPDMATLDAGAHIDRTQVPALAPDRPFRTPDVQSSKLQNGITVLVVQRTDLPKVAVAFATRAGSVADPAGKDGLASLSIEVMTRGTKTRKALEIDDQLGDLGTGFDGRSDREYASLSMEVLKRNLSPAVSVLADVARNPDFPADEVDREKKKRLDLLSQEESEPRSIADRVAAALAFGADHPYGHPERGYPSSVGTITSADLVKFHQTYWKPGSSLLVFVGDISMEEALKTSNEAFGGWEAGTAPLPNIPSAKPIAPGKVVLINRAGAAQTYIAQILPAPDRSGADYYPFMLADSVWGGAAGARLSMDLREEKGYSYGILSFPHFYSKSSMWIASGGVQTDKTKESVVEFEKQLHFLAGEKPVSEKELEDAKHRRLRGYAQEFESMTRVSQKLVALWALDRPVSDLHKEPQGLEQTSLSSVNGVAERYANPDHATLLLVGDVSKIGQGVRDAKAGEVVELTVEGRPVEKK